jgi:triosephosphate isomerase
MKSVIIAYEPIWAIGTGRTATSEQANEVCSFIRQEIENLFGVPCSGSIRILYGGSMNPKNSSESCSRAISTAA